MLPCRAIAVKCTSSSVYEQTEEELIFFYTNSNYRVNVLGLQVNRGFFKCSEWDKCQSI